MARRSDGSQIWPPLGQRVDVVVVANGAHRVTPAPASSWPIAGTVYLDKGQ